MNDSGSVCEKPTLSDDINGTSSAQREALSDKNANIDLPRPKANTVPSLVVSPNMKQTECENNKKELHEDNVTNFLFNEIENNHKDHSRFSKKLDNLDKPNSTESGNSFMQNQVRHSESHQKKENTIESLELPISSLINKEMSTCSPNQISSCNSERNTEGKCFSQNNKNQNTYKKNSAQDDEFNQNKNEANPNPNKQNEFKIEESESAKKSFISTEIQIKPDNLKPITNASEVYSQSNLSKTDSQDHSCLPMAIVSGNLMKGRQVNNVCSPVQDQSQSVDNSNVKSLPKNNQTAKNKEKSDKNFQILEKNNEITIEGSPRRLEMTTFHSTNDQMKSSFLRPLSKVPNDTITSSKQNGLGESLISSQFVPEQNRNKECQSRSSVQSFTGPTIYSYNSEPDLHPPKYANDYISTNSTNLYNNNQTYINTNQEPLNLIDTNSKFLPNTLRIQNGPAAHLPNQYQQFNQTNQQLKPIPNLNKDTFKSEYVSSSVSDSAINSFLLQNQSYYAQCNTSSLHYNPIYPHNSILRRSSISNQPVALTNNKQLPVQQPVYYSNQPVPRNASIPGSSSNSVMWTHNLDQRVSTETSSISENYGNLGNASSFDKVPKPQFQNSAKNNYFPVSIKDTNPQQNLETKSKPNVEWNREHSPLLQAFPACYNRMKHISVSPHLNNFPYINDYSFQSTPNYFKRAPSSAHIADMQNQNNAMQFQRSYQEKYQEPNHYHPSFQMQSYGSFRDTLHVPPSHTGPPPFLRAQSIASFNLQNRHDQHGPKSINSTVKPPKLPNHGIVNTSATNIKSASIFWSAKDFQGNKDSSTKELTPLVNDQLKAYEYSQNKNLEFNRHQTNTTNISKADPIISSQVPTTIQPIYNKDSGLSTADSSKTVCSSNSTGSILTWSQAHPLTFNPNRSIHVTHDGYANYNPQTFEGKPAHKYIPQQETVNSQQNSAQKLNNNYIKEIVLSFDTFQGSRRQQNFSNSSLNSNNYISTHNSNASVQNLESYNVENQTSTIIKKLPANSETAISPNNDQNTWKAQVQDKNMEYFIPSETSRTKLSTGSQFKNWDVEKDLDQKVLNGKKDEKYLPKATLTTMSEDFSFKTSDVLGNLAMMSDESFLFSDLDPLFTSSLLTNDLAYFPETNSAFDQCFEDAASIIMDTVNLNEAEIVEKANNIDLVEHSENASQLQRQPTILSNIPDYYNNRNNNTIPKSVPILPFLQKQSSQIINTISGTDPNKLDNSHSSIAGQNQFVLLDSSNEPVQTEVTRLNISSSPTKIGICAKTLYSDVNQKDSLESTFSDTWTSEMESQLVKYIVDHKTGNEWNHKKGQVQGKKEIRIGIKKRNQEKKPQPISGPFSEESSKGVTKKTTIIKGAPRPRGRPPKNRSLVNPNVIPGQAVIPGIKSSNTNTTNQTQSLDIHSKTSRVKYVTEILKQNSRVNLNDNPDVPLASGKNKCAEFESLTSKAKFKNKNISMKTFLVPDEHKTKFVSNSQAQCELSELELIEILTKRFDSISSIEEKESSCKIKNYSLSSIPESLDPSQDSSIKDSTYEPDGSSLEGVISREKILMKAYIKLKKKLDKRIKQSLKRQHNLRRIGLKINKDLWKFSKEESMTASSDTGATFEAEHLFQSYFDRSPYSDDDNKLIATADSTGIDADLNETHCSEKRETFEIETTVNRKESQDQSSITNDHFNTSTKVTETKDGIPRTGISLFSTRLIKEIKTCHKDSSQHLDPVQPDSLFDGEFQDLTKSPDMVKNNRTDCPKLVGKSQNIDEKIISKELLQVENNYKEVSRSNQQPDNLPSTSQTKIIPIVTQTCSLKTSPLSTSPSRSTRTSLQSPILQSPVKPEKVSSRKVGPTIVENAKICFQSINSYLEKDGSNFDSFLISYANIVHGLLNCGAERYNRIKTILLNMSKERSNTCSIENTKFISLSNSNIEEVGAKNSLIIQQDIDESDAEGNFAKGQNTIDMDDFSCSYAEIVKEILSSRADEYCNIKKAINRNICWDMGAYEEPIKSCGNRRRRQENEKIIISPLPFLSNSEETLNKSFNEKTFQRKNLGSDPIIKKRRKRRISKEKGCIYDKNEVLQTGNSCKPIRKRKTKKENNSSTQIEVCKGNTSISETKTCGSKIMMSNSNFVEQNMKSSNSSAKTKYSSLIIEQCREDYDSKCQISSDENFVEESTGDYVIGLGSESGSDERSTTISYTKPTDPVINPSSNDPAGNFSDLKQNFECDRDLPRIDEKTQILDSGFGDMLSITTPEKNSEANIRRASRKPTSTSVNSVKCPCGCSNDEATKDDSMTNQLTDLTMSFKTRNRSKIIKPKSASVSKKCGRLRKFNKNQEKTNPKTLDHIHRWEKNGVENDDHDKFLIDSDLKALKNLEDKSSEFSPNYFSVNNKITGGFLDWRDLDYKSKQNSCLEDDFGEEISGGSGFSDDSWKPEKSLKNTEQKTLQKKKKKKTRRVLSNCSLISRNNARVEYLDPDNFHREHSNEEKDEEENVSTYETKSRKKAAIKENNQNDNSLKTSTSFKDFTPSNKSSFISIHNKEGEDAENLQLSSFETIYDNSKDITSNNIEDKNDPSKLLIGDYHGTPNTTENSDDNVNISAGAEENVPCFPGDSKSTSKEKEKSNSMNSLNVHSSKMTHKENIEDEFDNVKEGPHSCEKRLRSLIENITEISRVKKRLDTEYSVCVKNSFENHKNTNKMDRIPSGHKIRTSEEIKVKTEMMETIDETIHCPVALAKFEDSSSSNCCLSSDEDNKKLNSFDRTYEVKLPSPLNKPKKKYKPTLKIKSIGIDNKIIIRKSYHKNSKKPGQHLIREDKNIFNIIGENITKEDKAKKSYIQENANKESVNLASLSVSDKSRSLVTSSPGSHKSKINRCSGEQIKTVQTVSKKSVPGSETKISNSNLKYSTIFPQKREQVSLPYITESLKFPASFETVKTRKENTSEESNKYSNDCKPHTKKASPIDPSNLQTAGNVDLNKKTNDSNHISDFPFMKVPALSSSSKDKKRKKTTEPENITNSLTDNKEGSKDRLIVGGDLIRSKMAILNKLPSEEILDEHLKYGSLLDNDDEIARKPKRRRSGKDRPDHQCTFCLKFFKSASELLYHTRFHTGDRPFVCDQCSKAFVSKSHLSRHQHTHSTKRSYVCPTCERGFTTHYSLLIHELIHSGLKPHTCGDCSKAFRTKGYLSRHRRKHHPVESVKNLNIVSSKSSQLN